MRLLSLLLLAAPASAADPAADFFEAKVRPLLLDKCVKCHGEKKQMGGLRLDTAAGVKAGSDAGPLAAGADLAKSSLLKAVRRQGDSPMPPEEPLGKDGVEILAEWVKLGTPFPERLQKTVGTAKPHWAFLPVVDPKLPDVKAETAVDKFLLAKLQPTGLAFAPPAEKRALIRRAAIDLTGLPPTYEDLEAFAADKDPAAFAKWVDKWLASPRYGERWARHWLDVARYADTKGYVFAESTAYPYAYTYRDYVIKALNDDLPYNQFVKEQLAADKLPPRDENRSLAALGFLTLGRRFSNNVHDILDDRIDTVTRGLMGLTVSCARCHDHKFDPVPAADYYSLYGIFASATEPKELPLIGKADDSPEAKKYALEQQKLDDAVGDYKKARHAEILAEAATPAGVAKYLAAVRDFGKLNDAAANEQVRTRLLRPLLFTNWKAFLKTDAGKPFAALLPLADDKLKAELAAWKPAQLAVLNAKSGPLTVGFDQFDKLMDRTDRDEVTKKQKKADQFRAKSPFAPPRAMVVQDLPTPVQPVVFLRGNPGNRGPATPRRMLQVTAGINSPAFKDSGRLGLAEAIADAKNPLTARVMVNRVWMLHFGQGLVRTPGDFGTRAEPPTHPELLDYLAHKFVTEDGWSLKKLHRRMMLTAAYRQAASVSDAAAKADPENKLLSRFPRKRLDFESLRDGLLAAGGILYETKVGGRSEDLFKVVASNRRSVYGYVDRQNLTGTYRVFDFASPDQSTPQRFQTSVPQQALFLMNSPFAVDVAKAAAAKLGEAQSSAEKVTALYRGILRRDPTREELKLATEFVAGVPPEKAPALGPWPRLAQVLLLSNEFAFTD